MKSKTALQHRAQGYDVACPDRPAGERLVTMSNALARAAHGLTLGEKRVICWAVSILDSRKVLKHGEVPTTRITAMDYAKEFKVDLDTAYTQLQHAANTLYKRSVTFYEPAAQRKGKPLPPTKVRMRWIGETKYQDGEGWIELAWWPRLLIHLTGLKEQFTSYQLQQASALRSVYSWRLLELLMCFKSTGVAEYTMEDFCTSMDATDKQRSDFAAIRRKMIEPAVKELTEKDGWLIKWEMVKAGRKVKAVRFTFMRNPQRTLDI